MNKSANIWMFGRYFDLTVLFLPVWLTWLICFILPDNVLSANVPLWVWVVFVIGIDVSHVWSTIFRTYLDKEEFNNHKRLLIGSPILVFLVSFLLAGISQSFFWTALAYLAVYHFVKQQYGFLRIYKAKFGQFYQQVLKDEWMIYLTMLYPIIYWHLSPKRNFVWFTEGDFFLLNGLITDSIYNSVTAVINVVYWLLIIGWVLQELTNNKGGNKPFGKILWLVTTAGNWFIGIVYFNSDLAFTLTNIVAHGIPYMALVFFYVEKKKVIKGRSKLRNGLVVANVVLMLVVVLFLAFGEEFLWDTWLYRDNTEFFSRFVPFSGSKFETRWLQAFAFGLLTVPQATHYVLDGFIWKGNKKNPYVKKVLIGG